ncbi:MAG: hypothetical protein ABIG61_13955 [Planctomycetota bacterium]
MSARLKVMKMDGTVEDYLHMKVLACVNNALALAGQASTFVAEQLTEAITYFLYTRKDAGMVRSSEVFSMIQVILDATNHQAAAVALTERHYWRLLQRRRTEVIDIDIGNFGDAVFFADLDRGNFAWPWDKSRIVDYLATRHRIDRQNARAIASGAEEKVLNMDLPAVPGSLIKQIVLTETASMLRAQQQLQAPLTKVTLTKTRTDKDVCLRQRQEGLCLVKS